MNRLEHNDGYITTSQKDREEIIELFLKRDLGVGGNTRRERCTDEAYNDYPVIQWDGHKIIGYRDSHFTNMCPLTRKEFLTKAGIIIPIQGDSKLRHKFIR